MAEPGNGGQGGAPGGQPNLSVLTQYVKDFSFENPGAPQSLRPRQQPPAINISVGVQSQPVSSNELEVELRIDARATEGQAVIFAIELVYAGIFRLTNIPPDQARPVALIECPRLLFPFARQIVADASRNGGFPPLLIDPVDFVAMYRQQLAGEQGGPGIPAN
jgi:preprotein translocase subunit SecB